MNDIYTSYLHDMDVVDLHESVLETLDDLKERFHWAKDDYSLDDAENFVAMCDNTHRIFAVRRSSNGRFLGIVSLTMISVCNKTALLGCWVRKSEAGKGIATEAMQQMIAYASRNYPDVHRIEALCAEDNLAMQKCMEKLKANKEGILKHRIWRSGKVYDAYIYSFIKRNPR